MGTKIEREEEYEDFIEITIKITAGVSIRGGLPDVSRIADELEKIVYKKTTTHRNKMKKRMISIMLDELENFKNFRDLTSWQ